MPKSNVFIPSPRSCLLRCGVCCASWRLQKRVLIGLAAAEGSRPRPMPTANTPAGRDSPLVLDSLCLQPFKSRMCLDVQDDITWACDGDRTTSQGEDGLLSCGISSSSVQDLVDKQQEAGCPFLPRLMRGLQAASWPSVTDESSTCSCSTQEWERGINRIDSSSAECSC